MKRILFCFVLGLVMSSISSCYEDFIDDYEYSSVYFSSQKPFRTVISGRDMSIKVGVAIGGKRNVSGDEWAEYKLDESLLEGTGLEMLPEEYYSLADNNKMTVSSNLPIADVAVHFTDEFYNDPKTVAKHYALPFRIVDASVDSVLRDKDYSIVAIKYVSTYSGAYYVSGEISEISNDGQIVTEQYGSIDLSGNIIRNLQTVSHSELYRQGLGNMSDNNDKERLAISFNHDNTISLSSPEGCIPIFEGSGSYDESGERLEVNLQYKFVKDGKTYSVQERMIRRQDPIKDLRFEEWK